MALLAMTENSSQFYRKGNVCSLFYGNERGAWTVGNVNINFVELCQEVVDITENIVKKAESVSEWSRDINELDTLRASLESDMWNLLQRANEDAGRWAEIVCNAKHDIKAALEDERKTLTGIRDEEWRSSYNKFRDAINKAEVNRVMKKGKI